MTQPVTGHDLAGLEAELNAASAAYEAALKVLVHRKIMGLRGVARQQEHVAQLNHALLRAELAVQRARRGMG